MRHGRSIVSALAPLALLATGCASVAPGPGPLVVYPPPPATARIQFLTGFGDSDDISGGRSFLQTLVGEADDDVKPIFKPFGVTIHNGKIYVCDTVYRGVEIIDLERGSFEYFRPRDLPARMNTPVNCSVDRGDGWLYVADTGRGEVLIYDADLEYVTSLTADGEFRPNDVFIDESSVWVTDAGNRVVRVYDRMSLEEVRAFPRLEPDQPGYLGRPTNIHVAKDRVYVTDFGAFCVKVYTHEGEFVKSIGARGDGLGEFARPKGIAVDSASILYAVDAAFANIQMFDPDGQLLMFFGGMYNGPGAMILPAQVTIDYENLDYFERYVDDAFELKYLVLVTNQYGPDKVSVYGFVEAR